MIGDFLFIVLGTALLTTIAMCVYVGFMLWFAWLLKQEEKP